MTQVKENPSTSLQGPELRPSFLPSQSPVLALLPLPTARMVVPTLGLSFLWAKAAPLPQRGRPLSWLYAPSTCHDAMRQEGFFLWPLETQCLLLGSEIFTAQASGPRSLRPGLE